MSPVVVNIIVIAATLAVVGPIFVWMVLDIYEATRPPKPEVPEMPEWLQGLTHDQLRELLQAKQHKTQPELHAMANDMRALNVVRYEALLVEPPALPFNTGAPEVA